MDRADYGRRERVGWTRVRAESGALEGGYARVLVMKESKKTSDDSIEEFLRDCMAEDFNVQLEDESHEEVGKVLRKCNEECGRGESMLVERIEKQKLPKEAMQLRDAIKEADMRNEGWKMAGVDEEMEDGDESESSSGEEMDDEDGDAEELKAGLKGWGRRRMSLMQMVGRRCREQPKDIFLFSIYVIDIRSSCVDILYYIRAYSFSFC